MRLLGFVLFRSRKAAATSVLEEVPFLFETEDRTGQIFTNRASSGESDDVLWTPSRGLLLCGVPGGISTAGGLCGTARPP